jgi:hypothetical protein
MRERGEARRVGAAAAAAATRARAPRLAPPPSLRLLSPARRRTHLVVKLQQLERAVALERAREVPELGRRQGLGLRGAARRRRRRLLLLGPRVDDGAAVGRLGAHARARVAHARDDDGGG